MVQWNKKDKEKSSFINFEIVDFYPSILKDLLTNYSYFVSTVTTIEKSHWHHHAFKEITLLI